MEEKNLLKEITFLSRLIGQHKKSQNIASSYLSQKIVNKIHSGNRNFRVAPYRLPTQNLKTVSRYSKVNHTLSQEVVKPCVGTTEAIANKIENKSQIKKLFVSTENELSLDEKMQMKHGEISTEVQEKKKSNTSVHINPNFFTNTKNTQQEIVNVRCKSVHVNPRLMSAVANNAASGSCNKETLPRNLVALSDYSPSALQNKTVQCALPCGAAAKLQSAVVPSKVSSEKAINLSVPIRTPTARKKNIYSSKTKLVKAVINTPTVDSKQNRKPVTPSNLQNVAKTIKTPHGGVLLAVSRTKLVRLPGKSRRGSSSKSDSMSTSQILTKSRYRIRLSTSTQSPLVRTARKVSSKYKSASVMTMLGTNSKYHLDHRHLKIPRKVKSGSFRSQYSLDHRSPGSATSPPRLTRVHSHLLISPIRRSSFNRTWTSAAASRLVSKVAISHKKLSRIGCNPGSRNYLQNSALVRIGDLLYKSSRTKLTLSRSSEKKTDAALKPCTVVKRRSLNAGHIVYVRGDKFVLDRSGKTLKRVTENTCVSTSGSQNRKKGRVSRVDIGGVTYIQKTPSVLVRTNTHTARNVLSSAKQRSIAFLAKKMRKINTPCLFYRRFGRCPRQEKGRCELVHDPKYIDICKRFLQGKCALDGCLLSHDVGPEKMPTCRFFLEGCCVRDLCPYLHVKVNDHAPICRSFLQGYCADGPECLKRHVLLCPEFDKKSFCAKGKYCPYPHSAVPQRAICFEPPITSSEVHEEQGSSPAPSKRKRYYETGSDELNNEGQLGSPVPLKALRYFEKSRNLDDDPWDTQSNAGTSGSDSEQDMTESLDIVAIRKRPKIGDLPSFIALESMESD